LHAWAARDVQHPRVVRKRRSQAQGAGSRFAVAGALARQVAVDVPKDGAARGAHQRPGESLVTMVNSGLGSNTGKIALERVMKRDAAIDGRRAFIAVEHLAVLGHQVH
jgi:hypothetical protein